MESSGPDSGGDEGAPEPQSFNFERTTPVEIQPTRPAAPPAPAPAPAAFTSPPAPVVIAAPAPVAPAPAPVAASPAPVPAAPAPAHEPRPEWTPAPPNDATREGPRSEP